MAGQLCANTNHLALCKAVVKNKPGTAMDATISMIQATIAQTELAKQKIEKLISKSSSKGGMAKMNLETCKEVYDDAISNLWTSIENAKANSVPDMTINLSAAMSDFSACEDGYLESPDTAFPMSHSNSVLSKLVSASLALASEVKK
ncbi:hypothetical protein Scep_021251 [Stephania cephalantha]|uniref:Pectinesterase inhibitor domain-containing protein n=1 Tax=Stephania cephalantha TaxID=152367 RepID=A0AAP0F5S2_9MAGN